MPRLLNHHSRFASLVVVALIVATFAFNAGGPAGAATDRQDDSLQPPTVDPGPGTTFLGPHLWGILQKHSINEKTPDKVVIELGLHTDVVLDTALEDYLASVDGREVAHLVWELPTDQALGVVQRADVAHAALVQEDPLSPHERLDDTLNNVVAAMEYGIPAADAVQYALFIEGDQLILDMGIPDLATAEALRAWMDRNEVYLTPGNAEHAGYEYDFAALLSANHIDTLLAEFPSVHFSVPTIFHHNLPMTRSRWSAQALAFEADGIAIHKEPEDAPVSETNAGHGRRFARSSEDDSSPWEVDYERKLERHGVKRWHDAGFKGNRVKIGIIDWSFADLADVFDETLTFVYDKDDLGGNAFCQPTNETIVANDGTLLAGSPVCGAKVLRSKAIRHGAHVTELVQDMAPMATLYFAQALSPRQVADAAHWLNRKNVDVIVHAGGWPYDGPGDGRSYFTRYVNPPSNGGNEHSRYRYYPSPLATVDNHVKDYGQVWVNASGNAEQWTMWAEKDDLDVIDDGGNFHGYVVFDQSDRNVYRKTCQAIPLHYANINWYSLRWADSWPQGKFDLDFTLNHGTRYGTGSTFSDSSASNREQHPRNYSVRRTSEIAIESSVDLCLRIRVNVDDDETPVLPEWIQFQNLVAPRSFDGNPNWEHDEDGHSIVNPAESNNNGLLAVGAMDLLNLDEDKLLDYSSRGPVFDPYDDLTRATPNRDKPDLVAGSRTATETKFNESCDEDDDADDCGDDLFFEGTTAATSHAGGITALAIQWLKTVGADHHPDDVAQFLRDIAVDEEDAEEWGHGFLELPCPSNPINVFGRITYYEQWDDTSCESERLPGMKANYYTFSLTRPARVN